MNFIGKFRAMLTPKNSVPTSRLPVASRPAPKLSRPSTSNSRNGLREQRRKKRSITKSTKTENAVPRP